MKNIADNRFLNMILLFTIIGEFPVLAVFMLLSIGFFAVGAGLISGFFSVNESKYIVTTASKIHGIGAAIGFMALLLFPLLNGIVSYKQNGTFEAIISISSFVLSLIFLPVLLWEIRSNFKIPL